LKEEEKEEKESHFSIAPGLSPEAHFLLFLVSTSPLFKRNPCSKEAP